MSDHDHTPVDEQEPTVDIEEPEHEAPPAKPKSKNMSDVVARSEAVDPMAAFMVGAYTDPSEDDDAPEEIISLFSEYGLSDRTYRCVLKEINTGSPGVAVIRNFASSYPSFEWIKNNCGPGDYRLTFMWQISKGERRNKWDTRAVDISVSPHCLEEYRQFQFDKKVEAMKRKREALSNAKTEKLLDIDFAGLGLEEDPKKDPDNGKSDMTKVKEQLAEVMDTAKLLGYGPPAQVPAKPAFDLNALLPALLTALPALKEMFSGGQNQMNAMMQLMLKMSQDSNQQLVELVKAQGGPSSGQQMMEEFGKMVTAALDVKELLQGKKESLADKLFALVENVAPHIAAVMAMPRQRAMTDPRMILAKNAVAASPDFQALREKENKSELIKFVNNMDAYFGWEQTDGILSVMAEGAIQRPEECPRRAEQQYPDGDPRNNPTDPDIDNDPSDAETAEPADVDVVDIEDAGPTGDSDSPHPALGE